MQHPSRNTPRSGERSHNSSLDISQLGDLVQYCLRASLAASTNRTYPAGQRRYWSFCRNTQVAPLPTLETTLCKFVAFLAHENLKHQTIKTYLSAVRNLQIIAGLGDPFQQSLPIGMCTHGNQKWSSQEVIITTQMISCWRFVQHGPCDALGSLLHLFVFVLFCFVFSSQGR